MEKKFKHGLILGKFYPPHLGHFFLIDNGIKNCENLTVLVCTLDRENIPGNLRYKWIRQHCEESALRKSTNTLINVIHIHDNDLPQEPSEHPDFWNIWCNLIKKNCPDIEAIFTSEDYGFELAQRMNIEHVLVDKERTTVPVSGTAIRTNPIKNWEFIPDNVLEYFLNRIYLMGPESTGKSVLSQRLAKHFETNFVPEFGRMLWEKKYGHLNYMDFYEIAIMQRNLEDKLACMMSVENKILFCDTEVMTTKVFAELMYPEHVEKLNPFFDYHINTQLKHYTGHYFLLSPDGVEAVQDGTRNFLEPDKRKNHFDLIAFELRRRNVPFTILTGSHDERFEQICNYINKILS